MGRGQAGREVGSAISTEVRDYVHIQEVTLIDTL